MHTVGLELSVVSNKNNEFVLCWSFMLLIFLPLLFYVPPIHLNAGKENMLQKDVNKHIL